jgi:hypothetical protein
MSASTTQNASAELHELLKFAEGLDLSNIERAQFQQIIERLEVRIRVRNLTLHVIKNALSALKFNYKHILFDLYATRRERDDYKRKLQDSGIDGSF